MSEDDKSGYWIDNDIEKRFFKNSQFCLSLKEYLFNRLSIEIEITLQTPPRKNRRYDETKKYRIYVINKSNSKPEMQQAMSDCIKQIFQMIKSKPKKYNDDKGNDDIKLKRSE